MISFEPAPFSLAPGALFAQSGPEGPLDAGQIPRGVDPEQLVVHHDHTNSLAGLERSQLLETFRALQGRRRTILHS